MVTRTSKSKFGLGYRPNFDIEDKKPKSTSKFDGLSFDFDIGATLFCPCLARCMEGFRCIQLLSDYFEQKSWLVGTLHAGGFGALPGAMGLP
jgi:hypothetical protein